MVFKIPNKIATNPKLAGLQLSWKDCYLSQVANDLVRKKYLPDEFGSKLLKDHNIQQASIWNYGAELFSEHSCPHCGIIIKGPKEWIKQHVKTHFRGKDKKDNEMQIARTKAYF